MPQPLIKLHDIAVCWPGRQLFTGVNLDINRHDFIAITGPNGGGKTTLLRVILGLLTPTHGNVTHPSGDITIGYLPQKSSVDPRFPISVAEVIESGLLNTRGVSPEERRNRVNETLKMVGLEDKAHTPLGNLSGGQMQRALLGRALMPQPQVLVLDEPLSYLDKQFEHQIYDLLHHLAGKCTIVLVSHEMTAIAPLASRHIIVDRGVHACHCRHHESIAPQCD